jgi:hypothetical protein
LYTLDFYHLLSKNILTFRINAYICQQKRIIKYDFTNVAYSHYSCGARQKSPDVRADCEYTIKSLSHTDERGFLV